MYFCLQFYQVLPHVFDALFLSTYTLKIVRCSITGLFFIPDNFPCSVINIGSLTFLGSCYCGISFSSPLVLMYICFHVLGELLVDNIGLGLVFWSMLTVYLLNGIFRSLIFKVIIDTVD